MLESPEITEICQMGHQNCSSAIIYLSRIQWALNGELRYREVHVRIT